MKKVSLKDVAAKAGVSTTLVSYVLNGKQSNRISLETAERIKVAAQSLEYSPNYLARSLKSNRSFILGLILADISNPFFSKLARVISDKADAAGYSLMIGSSDENIHRFQALISQFLSRQVDGLIIAPPAGGASTLELLIRNETPFVLVDRYFPGINVNSVCVDNAAAAAKAAIHFRAIGCRKMAIITYDSGLQHLEDRVKGAAEAWQHHGAPERLSPWIQRISEDRINEEMEQTIAFLLAEDTDAFFFTSNKLGVAGMRSFLRQGKSVPDEVSVVLFDENEAFEFFPQSIPYLSQPLGDIGSHAVDLLLQQVNMPAERSQLPIQQLRLPVEWVIP